MVVPIITIIIIGFMIFALSRELLRPGLILFSVLIVFMSLGIISTEEALAGFSNKGMITVAILFVISSAVEKTGVLSRIAEVSMPRKKGSMFWMILKVLPPVSFLSVF